MAQDIILKNQVWDDVPAVNLPIDGGGMQRFTDVSNTTAVPSDVASGKIFYNSSGIQQTGTSSGGGANLQNKTYNVSSAGTTTVTADSGYDGLSSVAVSVPSASFWTNIADMGFSTIDGIREWHAKAQTVVDPNEGDIEGWISAGNYDGNTQSFTAVPSNTTITPTESPQTIGGYKYMMEGAVTVNAIPSNYVGTGITRRDDDDMSGVVDDPYYVVSAQSGYYPSSAEFTLPLMTLPSSASSSYSGTRKANILPSTSQRYLTIPSGYNPTAQFYQLIGAELLPLNITQNGTYDPATYDVFGFGTVTVNVGGTSKNSQTAQSTTRATSSSYTKVISLTCSKAGTYHVYWSTFRSSTSGTWGSQLYIDDQAYGTAQTGSWTNHIQNIHLSSVTLSANADVSVRVRTRGNNYYGYVGTLTIIEA